jgi:hypothetical protein
MALLLANTNAFFDVIMRVSFADDNRVILLNVEAGCSRRKAKQARYA